MFDILNGIQKIDVTTIGALVTLVGFVTQGLKKIVSKKVPTQLLTILVSLIIAFMYDTQNITTVPSYIVSSILEGGAIAFASMYGYDTLKEIVDRLKGGGTKNDQ